MKNILKDMLEHYLMETHLFEMAYERKKAHELITSYQDTLAEHFIKCIFFINHQDFEHWKYELDHIITTKVNKIRLKPKDRKLKFEEYFKLLYDEPLGHHGSIEYILHSLFKFKKIPTLPNFDNINYFHNKLKLMYEELCDDLSIDNYNDINKYIELLRK